MQIPSVKAPNTATVETALRDLEDLVTRLCPGAERKGATDGTGEDTRKKGNRIPWNLQTMNLLPYSEARTMLCCSEKKNQ